MAFQPQGGQESQNRKILQDLQERKRQMMSQQSTAANTSSISPGSSHGSRPSDSVVLRTENHQLTLSQRQALEQANTVSPGYYVTQDSLYGNLILPVIPRLENDTTQT
ncbi:SOSS complex subunit C homolog [Exaiptasia diaphana]|uniref:Uncharacterized protein n=1 Tax=Exaiptasia diaphana TaxID=2652724 RepID=A0A913XAM9_EXADI|nr:SOSS complex subunit C homolog [Exaiptasia diaphana]KXJ13899.1 SOSS complex subunit C-like [Exaiptasia diaphana]